MQLARGYLRRRLVVLRWRFAFAAVLMSKQDREKLVERRSTIGGNKSDVLLEQVMHCLTAVRDAE